MSAMSSFITAEIAQSIKSGIARNIGPYAQQLVEEAAQFVFSIPRESAAATGATVRCRRCSATRLGHFRQSAAGREIRNAYSKQASS
jgi:hypothetical protein